MKWLPVGAGALLCVLGLAAVGRRRWCGNAAHSIGLAWCWAPRRLPPGHKARGRRGGLLRCCRGGDSRRGPGAVERTSMVFMVLVLGCGLWPAPGSACTRWRSCRAGLPWGSVAGRGPEAASGGIHAGAPGKTMTLWAQLVGCSSSSSACRSLWSALYFDRAFHDRDDFEPQGPGFGGLCVFVVHRPFL